MNAEWFQPLLDDALGVALGPAERTRLLQLLLELARANGGQVAGEFPEPLARARAMTAAEDAITAYLRASEDVRSPLVGFAGLLARVATAGSPPGATASPLAAIVRELERALAWVRTHPFPRWRRRAVESARRANEQATQEAQSRWLLARAYDDVQGAALALDEEYLPLATELVAFAQASVRVVMHLFHHDPADEDHPTRPLMEALLAAHARGVDVRVLLDRDRAGSRDPDMPRSRLVNQAAHDALAAAGVSVRWDDPERLTHSRLLVVDTRHVLLGSHAWTPPSLRDHDETSVYVESPRLGRHYFDVFGGRFEAAS